MNIKRTYHDDGACFFHIRIDCLHFGRTQCHNPDSIEKKVLTVGFNVEHRSNLSFKLVERSLN